MCFDFLDICLNTWYLDKTDLKTNIRCCTPYWGTLFAHASVDFQARKVFQKILPDEEFLLKAPNPEDIIYVDDNEAQVAKGDDQSEFTKESDDQPESKETTCDEKCDTELELATPSENDSENSASPDGTVNW